MRDEIGRKIAFVNVLGMTESVKRGKDARRRSRIVKESVREKSESGSNNGIENESSNGRETGSGNDNVIGNGSREKGSRKGRRGKGRLPEREGRKKNEELNKLAEIKKKEIEQT